MQETFLARFPVSVKPCRGFGLRPKMCRPSASTDNSRRTREKPLVPRVQLALLATITLKIYFNYLSSIYQPLFTPVTYRKIPKISPGAYIFQRPFLRGLFLKGLIFGGAYVRRKICVSKSIGLACSGKEIYHDFCFVLLCIRGQIPSTTPPGGLHSEGRFNGGFFTLRFWGAYTYTRRGLFLEFYGPLTYKFCSSKKLILRLYFPTKLNVLIKLKIVPLTFSSFCRSLFPGCMRRPEKRLCSQAISRKSR